jgi:hypothetical protein
MTINNNNIFGAFTLGEVRSGRLTGEWLNKESVANYGWFGGGAVSGPASTNEVDRIDFSNDSVKALARGPLSSTRYDLAATGNSNYGWFGGGTSFIISAARLSTVDRIDFSNDSSTASVRGPLSSIRNTSAATGNSNYGWFGGGYNATVPVPSRVQSTVDRIDFSNDSGTLSLRGPLSSTRQQSAATGNSNYGWFGGGAPSSTVDRIDFSNDAATASPRGPLSIARSKLAATGNSNYGWFGGGEIVGPAVVSTVNRIDFSNDSSTASVRGSLITTRRNLAATGNSNYGWFGGGYNPTPALVSTVNRIDFSNDSVSAPSRGSFSSARSNLSATSGVLNIRRQKAGNFGWFGGGFIPAATATINRIDFSNDYVTASPRGSLTTTLGAIGATGNSNYGWFGGGVAPVPTFPPFIYADVNRIDFSNDSVTASLRGPLSLERCSLGATGNSNYGWFGGGYTNFPTISGLSRVDRINFANDSVSALVKGSLNAPAGRFGMGATGNSNYGWFGGGGISTPAYVSTVDRIDFSNDSTTASPRGLLTAARYGVAATGNSNYGWFGGGGSSTPAYVSTVDRIDFSNDSTTASPRGPLSLAREGLAATGNSNYGWFGGGQAPITSRVDRIDFSNDSVTASVRGSIGPATGRLSAAAVSNTPT